MNQEIKDPRGWSRQERKAHLAEIGLPLIDEDEWKPSWSILYGDSHEPTEFSLYKGVLIEWTSTLDDRITEVIDMMTEDELVDLVVAYAHKGDCGFTWMYGQASARWNEGEEVNIPSGDLWTIRESSALLSSPPPFTEQKKAHPDQYAEYLKSDHWQHMRELALRHYGTNCVLCGNTPVDVHHRTYARKGREWLEDLIVLCRNCHKKFHRN